MATSVAKAALTTPDRLDVIGRPKMAKMTTDDKSDAESLSPLVKDAMKASWGTQDAAAAKLKKNSGNLSRDVDAERMTIGQLRELGPGFLAALGTGLVREYLPLTDPKDYIREQIRAIRRSLDEVAQYVESK